MGGAVILGLYLLGGDGQRNAAVAGKGVYGQLAQILADGVVCGDVFALSVLDNDIGSIVGAAGDGLGAGDGDAGGVALSKARNGIAVLGQRRAGVISGIAFGGERQGTGGYFQRALGHGDLVVVLFAVEVVGNGVDRFTHVGKGAGGLNGQAVLTEGAAGDCGAGNGQRLAVIDLLAGAGLDGDRRLVHGQRAGEDIDHIIFHSVVAGVQNLRRGAAGNGTGIGNAAVLVQNYADGFSAFKDAVTVDIVCGLEGCAVVGLGGVIDLNNDNILPLGDQLAAEKGRNRVAAVYVHTDPAVKDQLPAGKFLVEALNGSLLQLFAERLHFITVFTGGEGFISEQLAIKYAVGADDLDLCFGNDLRKINREDVCRTFTQIVQDAAAVSVVSKNLRGDRERVAVFRIKVQNGIFVQLQDLAVVIGLFNTEHDRLDIKVFGNSNRDTVFLKVGQRRRKAFVVSEISGGGILRIGIRLIVHGLCACILLPQVEGGLNGTGSDVLGPCRRRRTGKGEHEHQNQHGAEEYSCCSFHIKSPQE